MWTGSATVLLYMLPKFVLTRTQVNPQLKGHLKGALNNGASVEEVRAVRGMVLDICETYGMRHLQDQDVCTYGWRTDVANL